MNLSDQLELITHWFRFTASAGSQNDNDVFEDIYEETFPGDSDHASYAKVEDYHSIDFSVVCDGTIGLYMYEKNNYYGFYCNVYDYEDLNTPIITLRAKDAGGSTPYGGTYKTLNVKAFHKYVIRFSRYLSTEESYVSLDIRYNVRPISNRFIRHNY